MMKNPFKGAGHRFVGYLLLGVLWVAALAFCVWFKSFWNEPLGFDGIVLSFVLTGILYKALPAIRRLVSK